MIRAIMLCSTLMLTACGEATGLDEYQRAQSQAAGEVEARAGTDAVDVGTGDPEQPSPRTGRP